MKRIFLIIFFGLALVMFSSSIGQTEEPKQKLEAKVIKTVKLSNLIPTDLLFSPDGNLLFYEAYYGSFNPSTKKIQISMDGNNFIMDVKRGKNIANLKEMSVLCFSNENEVLIKNNGIRIWDYKKKKEKGSITNINGSIYCTSDGKYAVTIIDGEKAIITDLILKNQIGDYQLPQIYGSQVKFIFDGPDKLFMVCLKDKILKLIDIIQNQELVSFSWDAEGIKHAAISSDCKSLAVSSGGPIYLLNIPEKSIISKTASMQGILNSLSFSRNSYVLGGCTSGNEVVLLDMKSKTETFFNLDEHKGPIKSICFSPIEDIFITSSFDGTIKIWKYSYVVDN